MTEKPAPTTPIPPDDPARHGVHVNLESPDLQHISLVGDTYTVLVSGEDTAGAYTLIDMLVPEGAAHRRTAMTSKRCSPSWMVRSKSICAA